MRISIEDKRRALAFVRLVRELLNKWEASDNRMISFYRKNQDKCRAAAIKVDVKRPPYADAM